MVVGAALLALTPLPRLTPSVVSYDEFKKATETELKPQKIHVGTLGECTP